MNNEDLTSPTNPNQLVTDALLAPKAALFESFELNAKEKQTVAEELAEILITGCNQPESSVSVDELVEALATPSKPQWSNFRDFILQNESEVEYHIITGLFYNYLMNPSLIKSRDWTADQTSKAALAFQPSFEMLQYFGKSSLPAKMISYLKSKELLTDKYNSEEEPAVISKNLKPLMIAAGLYTIFYIIGCILQKPQKSLDAA